MAKKKRLKPEEIIYKLKTDVEAEYFAKNPLKRFPEDFLTRKAKRELFAEARSISAQEHKTQGRKTEEHKTEGIRTKGIGQKSRPVSVINLINQKLRRDREAKINPKFENRNSKYETAKRKRKPRSRKPATIYRSLPGGLSHQVRHRMDKVDFRKAMELHAEYKKAEAKMLYEVISLPAGLYANLLY